VRHLLGLGHTRIGHLAADLAWKQLFALHDEGRREALTAAGVEPDAQAVERAMFTLDDARAGGRRLLRPAGHAGSCSP